MKNGENGSSAAPSFFVLVGVVAALLFAAFLFVKTRPNPSEPIYHALSQIQGELDNFKAQAGLAHKNHRESEEKFARDVLNTAKLNVDSSIQKIFEHTLNIRNELLGMVKQPEVCQCTDQDMFRAREVNQFYRIRNEALAALALSEIAKNCAYVSQFENVPESELQPFPTKSQRLIEYGARYNISTMVETGTFYGGTTMESMPHFKKMFTIELSKELYQAISPRFEGTHVTALQGDSAEVLKTSVLPQLNDATIFWLDGHYSSTGTARGNVDTPIYAELLAILSHPKASKFVLVIDDMRLFKGYTPECMDRTSEDVQCYPSIANIGEIFCAFQPHTKMSVRVSGDALIAVGGDLRAIKSAHAIHPRRNNY